MTTEAQAMGDQGLPAKNSPADFPVRKQYAQIISGIAIVLLFLAAPYAYWYVARMTPNPDPFEYGQAAKEVLQGKKLYTDMYWDKGPLSVLFYIIPELISPRSYPAFGAFLGVCLDIQALLFVWLFRRKLSVALACALVLIALPLCYEDWLWLSTEYASNIFVVPCLIIAFQIATHRQFSRVQCLTAGLLACLAMNVRQTAIMVSVVPAIAILWAAVPLRKRMIGLGMAAAGGLIGLIIVLLVVAVIASPRAYFEAFGHAAKYPALMGSWKESLALLSWSVHQPIGVVAPVFILLALVTRYWPLVLTGALAGLWSVVMTRQTHFHYWEGFFPYITFFAGIGLYKYGEWFVFVPFAGCIFLAIAIMGPANGILQRVSMAPTWGFSKDVGEAIDVIAPPGAKLLALGSETEFEAVIFASRTPPIGKYWEVWFWDGPYNRLLPISVQEIESNYLANPPGIVIVEKESMKAIRGLAPWREQSEPEEIRFGRLLFKKYDYHFDWIVNNFDIGILSDTRAQPKNVNPPG